jgi:hypothetical protein
VTRAGIGALLMCLAAGAVGRTAAAQTAPEDGHVYLSWVRLGGADSCPDVRQIADDVSRRLGWNPFRESPTRFIEAQIRRDGTWVAEVFLRDASGASRGNREFTSSAPTCASLASVVALSIAIIIDPNVMIRRFSEDKPWPEAPDAAPEARPPRREPSVRGSLLLLGGAGVNLLPRPAPGGGLAGEVRVLPRLAVRVGGVVLPEVRTPLPDDGFAFGLTAGWVGACFDLLHRERVSLGPCAAAMAGLLHAVVYTPDSTHPGQRALFGATGGARLAVRLSTRVEAQVGSDGVLVLNRRQFTVDGRPPGMDVAWLQPAAGVLLWAAVGVAFR